MGTEAQERPLTPQTADYVASAVKAVVGAAPFAGSLLVEIAGAIIPNQRIDRLARFATVLEDRISRLEQGFVRSQLGDETFTDLLEDSMKQAAQALSSERRDYIASLIANGLSHDNVSYVESKHLLRILSELNDVEIIHLGLYTWKTLKEAECYREKHRAVLNPVVASIGSSQEEVDQATLQESYRQHLAQLGLLRPRPETDIRSRGLQYDRSTGAPKQGYELAPLGRLLCRQIGLAEEPS